MRSNNIAKRVSALALCAVLTTGTLMMSAGAVSTNVTAQLSPNISVVVDGVYQTFYNVSGSEVHPIVYNGTTYLPLRAVGELMGKNVNWDQTSLTASLSGTRTTAAVTGVADAGAVTQNVAATISTDITVTVDGVARTFTDVNGNVVYPMVYNGSIYLPLRAIGNLMGKSVNWNSATSTVTLSGAQSSCGILVTDADSFNNGTTSTVQTPPATQTPTVTVPSQNTSSGMITADQAKSKALAHAGLNANQVNFVRAYLDWDDGRQVYDVEFYTSDYKEYDYEIDAYTGAVLSFDYDADYYAPPANNTQSGSYISQSEAIRIALSYVSGATQSNVRYAKLDRDDGRLEYEVEIIYGTTEYDFEIDAYTGTVISRDMDSIYD